MSMSDHIQLTSLNRSLLEAMKGAAAILDDGRVVRLANNAWLGEYLPAEGERLDAAVGRLSAIANCSLNADGQGVFVDLGGMDCVVHSTPLADGLNLVQLEIVSESDERQHLGEAMEQVLQQFPVVYFRIADDGAITESLGAGLRSLGLADREAVGWNVFAAFPNIAADIRRGLRGETVSYIAEGEFQGRDWAFRTYLSPDIRAGSGVLGIALDVTEHVKIKEALLESERRLLEVANQIPGVVYCYDSYPNGERKTLFMGAGLESLLGEQIAAAVKESPTPLFDRISAEGLAEIRRVGPECIDRGELIDLEYEMRTDEGNWVWVRNLVQSVRHPDGTVRNTGVLMDVTEKHNAEAALRESRELLARTQDLANIGGWKHDVKTNEVAWTEQVFEILGVSPDTTPSLDIILAKCDEQSAALLRESSSRKMITGDPCDLELTIFRTPDDRRTVRLTGEAQFEDGKPVVLWGTMQDITVQRELELGLRHAQKMEAVGQLASGIAHEFNNLISTVSGHVDIARQSCPPDGPGAESLDHVAEAMERAFGLARGLLAFSRKAAPRREMIDASVIVEQAERLLRRTISKRITLNVDAPGGMWVHADPAQLLQVILNLAINARDAMPHGGDLSIAAHADGAEVAITVVDTGDGIPESNLRRIFEPFFTTKPSDHGTGLGLALSRGIVEDHDGRITVVSTPGMGATFVVALPQMRQTEERTLDVATDAERLAVLSEAQPFARSLLTTILGEHGFHVCTAASNEEALELAPSAALTVISCYDDPCDMVVRIPPVPLGSRVLVIAGAAAGVEAPPGVSILSRPFRSADLGRLLEPVQ